MLQSKIIHHSDFALGLILALLMLATTSRAHSQAVDLPDVRVSAESSIRSYLYKKTMRFGDSVTAYDTLPTFIPRIRQVPLKAPAYLAKEPLDAFMSFKANSEGSLGSHLSYYPAEEHVRLVRVDYSPQIRNKGLRRQHLDLSAELPFDNHLLSPFIRHRYHSDPQAKAYHSLFGMKYRYPSIDIASIRVIEPRIELAYYDLLQMVGALETQNQSILVNTHSGFEIADQTITLDFKHQQEHTGLRLLYDLPQQPIPLEEIKLGLITDFHGLAPSIEFRYRPVLSQNQYFELSHNSSLDYTDSFENLDRYTQVVQAPTYRVAYRPFDLKLSYDRLFPGNRDLRILHAEASSSYIVNSTILRYNAATQLCRVVQEDLFENSLGLKLIWRGEEADLSQSVKLNLDFVPTESYRRSTYSPLLELDSILSFKADKLDYQFVLEQNYNRLNYRYRHLPEDIDLSFSVSYPINDRYKLYAGLKRVFGSKARDCDGLRMQRRELWAELRVFL